MIEIRKKYKLWFIVAGYIAAVGLAGFFIIAPLHKKTFELAESIQRVKVDDEINREKMAKISETDEQSRYFKEKTSWLDGFLDYNEEMDFIKKLEALSEETGNKVNLKIEEPLLKPEKKVIAKERETEDKKDSKKKEDIISTLPYSKYIILRISIEGTYDGLFRFIQKLENFEYYVNITSIQSQRGVIKKEEKTILTVPLNADNPEKELIEKKEIPIIRSEISAVVYTRK